MQMMFTSQEREYIVSIGKSIIADDCPDDIRKSILAKFKEMDDYANKTGKWSLSNSLNK